MWIGARGPQKPLTFDEAYELFRGRFSAPVQKTGSTDRASASNVAERPESPRDEPLSSGNPSIDMPAGGLIGLMNAFGFLDADGRAAILPPPSAGPMHGPLTGTAQAPIAGMRPLPRPFPIPIPIPPIDPDLGTRVLNAIDSAIDSGRNAIGEAVDAIKQEDGKTFQTYTKPHVFEPWIYAGRTSGFGTPQANVEARNAANYPPGYYPGTLDRSSERYSAIRGREQQLIDYYRSLGISGNQINGISPLNPMWSYYHDMATREFGPCCD